MKTTSAERLSIATTIDKQVRATVESVWVYFSWGISKKIATEYNGMPALQYKVSGVYHKGYVYIAYNYGTDLYDIFFTSVRGTVKNTVEDVYAEDLGGILDRYIERGTTSIEEYARLAKADSEAKTA